jgi:hypothetical protein
LPRTYHLLLSWNFPTIFFSNIIKEWYMYVESSLKACSLLFSDVAPENWPNHLPQKMSTINVCLWSCVWHLAVVSAPVSKADEGDLPSVQGYSCWCYDNPYILDGCIGFSLPPFEYHAFASVKKTFISGLFGSMHLVVRCYQLMVNKVVNC